VIVYCVNDAAVMGSWEKDQKVDGSDFINFMGDPSAALTEALDMKLEPLGEGQAEVEGVFAPYFCGVIGRCKRFAMYIEDGDIKLTKVAQALTDPAGDDFPEATLAPTLLEDIKGLVPA